MYQRRQKKRKFVIRGNNGNTLIEDSLTKRGWDISERDDTFHLKWTELKSHIDYDLLVEGKQLANHIPSSSCITTKSGLLNSLRSYFGSHGHKESESELATFFPETYRLEDCREKEKLLTAMGDPELWICKPTNLNQGKGIFLFYGKKELVDYLEKRKQKNKMRASSRIVQRYIEKPFLIHGRKFDIRVYLLVGSTRPYNVFFHNGYLRLAVNEYDITSQDLSTHLTNQYVQKKHPNYQTSKNDTVWSMDQFQEYLNQEGFSEKLNLSDDWVFTGLKERMKNLAYIVFKSAQTSLTPKIGLFDLYGLDFMLDESMNVWLLEVNTNPALHTHCSVLESLLPPIIDETLGICIELFDKKVSGIPLYPILSLNQYELIYSSVKDQMVSSIEMPISLDSRASWINRGGLLSPIKCTIPSQPTPAIRNKTSSSKKSKFNVTSSIPKVDAKCSDKKEEKKEEKKEGPQLQIPLKLALIEVAPSPKQDVL